ncbi:hypothetical protein D3C78_1949170 [compost metagenome]
MTIIPPEPAMEPRAAIASGSRVTPMASSAVRIGQDEPPGITALSLRPFQTPPRFSARKSLNGMPISIS